MISHSRTPPAGPAVPVLLWGPEPSTGEDGEIEGTECHKAVSACFST